jgi:signal transduction histidine kinase
MRLSPATLRATQIALLVLLVACSAQVLWWFIDQRLHSAADLRRLTALYEADRQAAVELLATGEGAGRIEQLFPHLQVNGTAVQVRPEEQAALTAERARRLRQYGWEGSFFLLVLVGCMVALWRALRQETELRQRQENFIAAASHELKSPLASLRLSTETLALRQPDPQRARQLVERLLDDLARMEHVVAKILDTARLEQGRFELASEALHLAPAVAAVLGELETRAGGSGVHLASHVPAELAVEADPIAVRTVVRNLVENAVNATATQGGGEVVLEARAADGYVELSVHDDGIGFAPEESSHLFEKFYRPGDELRRRSAGTGLGLFIVQRLMEVARGRVAAHSDGHGRGAVFTVSWPAAGTEDAEGRRG